MKTYEWAPLTSEELDVAADLLIETCGVGLTREQFDPVARPLVPTIGLLDRLWARYLLRRAGR